MLNSKKINVFKITDNECIADPVIAFTITDKVTDTIHYYESVEKNGVMTAVEFDDIMHFIENNNVTVRELGASDKEFIEVIAVASKIKNVPSLN